MVNVIHRVVNPWMDLNKAFIHLLYLNIDQQRAYCLTSSIHMDSFYDDFMDFWSVEVFNYLLSFVFKWMTKRLLPV